jgi:hypothetical protein
MVHLKAIMEMGKNILEMISEKRLRWFGCVKNARKQTANENQREREEREDPKRDGWVD